MVNFQQLTPPETLVKFPAVNKIKLFIKSGCPWCIDAKRYLDTHQFSYHEIEVRSNPAAFTEMQQVSGQTYAPTLTVGDLVLADFDTDQLEAFFAKHEILP